MDARNVIPQNDLIELGNNINLDCSHYTFNPDGDFCSMYAITAETGWAGKKNDFCAKSCGHCRKFMQNRFAQFYMPGKNVKSTNFRVPFLSLFRIWASEEKGRFRQRREGPKPGSPTLADAC
jgi:hypothetical protein